MHIVLEDNFNQYATDPLRVYALLDLGLLVGQRGLGSAPATGIGPGLGGYGNPLGNGMGY